MFGVGDTVPLTDVFGRYIGSVRIDDVSPEWVSGDFTPGPQFGEVAPLFAEFEQLVNDQALSLLDSVMDSIAELGLRSPDGTALRDIQIYPAARGANWRPAGYRR
ncbi:hypothetical protein GobsT_05470 [Gemmata obscuriglobus]|uniref:Uncharacterized protein n=1 Tax=Gemmata obscuriglobus TaxID=114 RepID=A0A2Z3H285_9BACT|nr:hypothetical protein [Gemmata obscuriglobus]AWM40889.1 hypothetical protein C1280_30470 [Gemmata obscuriglobus]QEG25812.1 hypothetical protein GobsT_05470 [Gemmata obscuriglobus]VTR99715.1 Uncharacterized protein OS=Candidatus Entotheonella sp. TSY1 GN=ETSY1_30040 PE=4 SV=1 [Gemmata obscuriglobus UQM 2246]